MIPEAEEVIRLLTEQNTVFKVYNDGLQINAEDIEGIVHSFYPTTGTVILHASNDRHDHRHLVFRNKTALNFAKGMQFKNLSNFYFKEEM